MLSKLLNVVWSPSITLVNPSRLPSKGLLDSGSKGFHFLIRLAWESRYLLPIICVVLSFVLDTQMRVRVNIEMDRRVVHVDENVAEADQDEDADTDNETGESGSETDYAVDSVEAHTGIDQIDIADLGMDLSDHYDVLAED